MTVPRWLELLAERDLVAFQIEQLAEHVRNRTSLDLAIDAATGHEAELNANALYLMTEHRRITRELDALDVAS